MAIGQKQFKTVNRDHGTRIGPEWSVCLKTNMRDFTSKKIVSLLTILNFIGD